MLHPYTSTPHILDMYLNKIINTFMYWCISLFKLIQGEYKLNVVNH